MGLCTLCQAINVNNLVPHCDLQEDSFTASYEHQPSYKALVESALSCSLCDLFLHALEVKNAGRDIPETCKDHEKSHIWLLSGDEVFFDLSLPKRISQVRVNVGAGGIVDAADLSITALPDSPLALSGDVVGRSLERGRHPEAMFDRIRNWFYTCQGQHHNCEPPSEFPDENHQPLPSRLIALGPGSPPEQAVLLESGGQHGQYAALSYCWGTSRVFTTTRETYTARLSGFSISELPRTIHDAVLVTHQLGLRFLWVDAICIIQGDAADWELESARMAQVYGNAAITISATTSPDANSGCLNSGWSASKQPVALRSKCSGSDETGTMFISEKLGPIDDALDRAVLNSRGWCLQERILSRRIIHFAREQLYWECQKITATEDGMVLQEANALKRCLHLDYSHSSDLFSRTLRSWHIIVTEYCLRDLSHISAKLPALSGIASIIQRRIDSPYLAGLWLADLPFALAWFIGSTRNPRPTSVWRAPSWSWASIDGPVNSQGYRIHMALLQEKVDQAKVVSHSLSVGSLNPFGEVTNASLTIRARKRQARRHSAQKQYDYGGWKGNLGREYPVVNEQGAEMGEINFDNPAIAPPLQFECLLLCAGISKARNVPEAVGLFKNYFLAVAFNAEKGQHTRVGAGVIWEERYFDMAPWVEVTLI